MDRSRFGKTAVIDTRLWRFVMREEATYVCDACGEEIETPIDLSQGAHQEYVEDCPVCCRPNLIHVEIDVNP